MAVVYKNMGQTITASQAQMLKHYNKLYTNSNGEITKDETYIDGILAILCVYKYHESEESIVKELTKLNLAAFGVRTIELYGSYKIIRENIYRANQFACRTNTLENEQGNTICFEEIDPVTDQPLYEYTSKYLGEYVDEQSVYYCWFHYKEDGSLNYCEFNYMHDYDSDEFREDRISFIKDTFMLSDAMFEYYLTATFLPPL
jgi:hypothetical protein